MQDEVYYVFIDWLNTVTGESGKNCAGFYKVQKFSPKGKVKPIGSPSVLRRLILSKSDFPIKRDRNGIQFTISKVGGPDGVYIQYPILGSVVSVVGNRVEISI